MSMSSLGRQLAALQQEGSGGEKHAGSALATSRRHEDAVGRGVAHSVQLGHGLARTSHSAKYKPSILYEDARQAADVPLATVKENAVASLRQLQTEMDPSCGVYVTILCGKHGSVERGLQTGADNDAIDKYIEDLLYKLSLYLATKASEAKVLSSCLHIVEFLLRQHDLHLRPRIASAALLALLPHHEEPYFLRLLQLIDLARLPEWTFLRPYAGPQAQLARSVLAKQASKSTAMVRMLGQLSQKTAALLKSNSSNRDIMGNNGSASGSTKCLSFSSAVLVEALTLQMKRAGSMDEATCAALLPFVVTACKSGSPNGGGIAQKSNQSEASSQPATNDAWINWGYILVSTMVEAAPLAARPRKVLVTSVLQGLPAFQYDKIGKPADFSAWYNGLIVALTVLAQDEGYCHRKDDYDSPYLPILSPSSALSVHMHCGYATLDMDVLKALVQLDKTIADVNHDNETNIRQHSLLATCLGQLLAQQGLTDFAHMIASILVVGWRRQLGLFQRLKNDGNAPNDENPRHSSKYKKKREREKKQLSGLIMSLVEEPLLQENLWGGNDGQWVASYTSFILLHTPLGASVDGDKRKGAYTLEGTVEETAFAKGVLKALRRVDKLAYEKGLAHGLMHLSSLQTRKSWAHWLGLADISKAKEQAESGWIIDDSRESALILPSRVSLEHADYTVRLAAIPALLKEAIEENVDAEGGNGETIAQSLMRRFLMDDNEEMALAAAKGLTKLVVDERVGGIGSRELGKDAIEAVFLWAEKSTLHDKQKAELLWYGLRLVSFAATNFHDNRDDSMYLCLLECLGTFMSNANEEVALSAACGTILALSGDEAPQQRIDAFDRARVLLVSDEHVVRGFRRDFERPNRSEQHFRRHFVSVLLHSFEAALSFDSGSGSRRDARGYAIDYCIWVKTAYVGKLTTVEMNAVGKCLLRTVDYVTATPELLHATMCQLAASDGGFFDTAVAPFLAAVCRNMMYDSGKKVSPVAVIMEIALSTDDANETTNLLSVAKDLIATSNASKEAVYAVVPSLALLCHDSTAIRSLAVDILSLASKSGERNMENLYELCTNCLSNRSSVLLGGAGFLAETLATFLAKSTKAALIKKSIMSATLRFAAAYGSINSTDSDDYFVLSWLGPGMATGGYKTAATLLEVFEAAGDRTFSIHSRWKLVGKPLLDVYHSPGFKKLGSVSESLLRLVRCTVQILKGARLPSPNTKLFVASKTIITTGPASRGGRSRSYSFGKAEGVSFVSPYPREMQTLLLSILSTVSDSPLHGVLQGNIFDLLFRSQSWRNEVFSALPVETKHGIALAILSAASERNVADADLVFFSLPLNAGDVSQMLEDVGDSETELARLAFLSDFVRLNREALIAEPSVAAILTGIFKKLVILSKVSSKRDSKEYKYLRHTLLVVLHEFFESESGSHLVQWCSKDDVKSWLDLLVDLLGANENSVLVPLVSIQSIRKAYGVLAFLSRLYPKEACPKLIPTLGATIASFQSLSGEASSLAECLNVVVPAYLKNRQRSGLSVEDLLISFVRFSMKAKNELRHMLYQLFVESLEGACLPGSEIGGSLVGAFIGSTLACDIYLTTKDGKAKKERGMLWLPELAASMIRKAHLASKLQIIYSLHSYAKDLLFTFIDEESANDASSVIFSSEDLASMVRNGPNCVRIAEPMDARDNITVEELTRTLMVVVCDAIGSHDVRRLVKLSKEDLMIVFRMWHELLLVQAVCNRRRRLPSSLLKASVVERVGEIATQTLDALQGNLTNHNFLAFATTLISNGETDELRARAIQLIVDRTEVCQFNTAEATLFLEMVPTLLGLVDLVDGTENSKILLQSIFVAIESIGRKAFLSFSDPCSFNPIDIFANVAEKAAQAINNEWQAMQGSSSGVTSSASRQLVISAALCSSTAIKISGPSIISAFPLLIRSLLHFLDVANQLLRASVPGSQPDLLEWSQAKIVQLAILRFLTAAVEKLPQFLKPYLGNLLQRVSQGQESLGSRSDNESLSVQNELQQLELSLILRIPARQLIHAASKSIVKTENTMSTQWILSILSESVKASKSTVLASQTNDILKVATHAFEEEDGDTVEYAIELLLVLILKLSEVQLRSLYSRLRDWRGRLDQCDPAKSSRRRFAFWKLSSRLSKQLKSIFLPCLSIVFSDAMDELELAVSSLCKKEAAKKSGGKKRQKLSGQGTPQLDAVSLQSLKSLLLCLGLSLRADAHDGGIWVREAEAQRFDLLLEPLARLLQSRLPLESTSQLSYRHLVRGQKEEGGTVRECIVALALATGDEQMWKPMNHAVLQACSNEGRPEVRNAGVACLLSLITSIGEEYMVLIPECLPVLSELLEDTDEETAGLAQECISQSEELLGESLQDSLR